jgi:hypothetical protein
MRLRQLQGLALSRSGATERANAILENLRREQGTGEETLGMAGRTHKELPVNSPNDALLGVDYGRHVRQTRRLHFEP